MMLRALILIAALPISYWAQDIFDLNANNLSSADLIVIGTLRQDFKFPWLDGWNERGHIEIERILKGSQAGTIVSFAWERDFNRGWCLTRQDWSGAAGKRGIWVLERDGTRYRAAGNFAGFVDINRLQNVTDLLWEGLTQRVVR